MNLQARHLPAPASASTPDICADTAICDGCRQTLFDPTNRRYRYAVISCAHCGPKYSISLTAPGDRDSTSMHTYALCARCEHEFNTPGQRLFHAASIACHDCGPQVRLTRTDNKPFCLTSLTQLDEVDAACTILQNGGIVAVHGFGGFDLLCDATNEHSVKQLRHAKRSPARPFAMMARDIDTVRRYALVNEQEAAVLSGPQAPIVVLQKRTGAPTGKRRRFGTADGLRSQDLRPIADAVAPGQNTLGFMLPYSGLHHLLLKRMNRPVVVTSANVSGMPRCIDQSEIKRFDGTAEYILWHDQQNINRIDDSVCRIVHGKPRLLRLARGHAPAQLPLPAGFDQPASILATGSRHSGAFCLLHDRRLVLAHHHGNPQQSRNHADYQISLCRYMELFQHTAEVVAVDASPTHILARFGRQYASHQGLDIEPVQHTHAHIAACMAENHYPLHGRKLLGIVLDRPGATEDDPFRGGEFVVADYHDCVPLASFKPVDSPAAADTRYPLWRDCHQHLLAEMSWAQLKINYGELELITFLEQHAAGESTTASATMQRSSSCSRLIGAVAAAMGLCRNGISYPEQAMHKLEAIVDPDTLENEDPLLAYPFAIPLLDNKHPYIEPLAMWQALLGDLILDTPRAVMAARFYKGLANILVRMVDKLCMREDQRVIHTVALSGSVFQQPVLFSLVVSQLESRDYRVLTHSRLPANDSCVAVGQAVVAAARRQRQ